jgi:hypothetical protein
MMFGQEHYPAGIYVPTLILKDDNFIHPKERIEKKFEDGDKVVVYMKNRRKEPSEDERGKNGNSKNGTNWLLERNETS